MSAFPWDTVKAETLRSIAREIGFSSIHKRDDMIHLFRTVEQTGLDAAIEEEKELRTVALSKRKADFDSPRPKRTRRSDPRPVTMVTRYKGVSTKSYRTITGGKSKRMSTVKKSSLRAASRKFDGVVLSGRRRPGLGKRKRQEEAEGEENESTPAEVGSEEVMEEVDEDGDADADGEVDQDEVEQQDQKVVIKNGSEPPTGNSSEKENERPFIKRDEDHDQGSLSNGDAVKEEEEADATSEDVGDYVQTMATERDNSSAAESRPNGNAERERIVPVSHHGNCDPSYQEDSNSALPAEGVPEANDFHTNSNGVEVTVEGQENYDDDRDAVDSSRGSEPSANVSAEQI